MGPIVRSRSHGIVPLCLENLISSKDMHTQLPLYVQLVAGLCRIVRRVPVDNGIQNQGLSVGQVFFLEIQDSFLVLLYGKNGERFQKVHGAFAETARWIAFRIPDDDAIAHVRRVLVDPQTVHGGMVHPVGVVADIGQDDGPFREALQHIGGQFI